MSTAVELLKPSAERFVGIRAYAQLLKVRVTALVVLTSCCGAYLAFGKSRGAIHSTLLLAVTVGVGLVAGGTAGLNEVMERSLDARMIRTRLRPVVTGVISPAIAKTVCLALLLAGTCCLALYCNLLTSLLAFATSAVYLGLYTPLKTKDPICTFIGAFPGAMPPVLGWVAVRGQIEWETFVLFGIVFLWQFPHFHSIAVLYRDDYRSAGIKMLAVVDRTGHSIVWAIILPCIALLPVSLLPALLGEVSRIYVVVALALGLGLMTQAARANRALLSLEDKMIRITAQKLLRATILYLPALFVLLILTQN